MHISLHIQLLIPDKNMILSDNLFQMTILKTAGIGASTALNFRKKHVNVFK